MSAQELAKSLVQHKISQSRHSGRFFWTIPKAEFSKYHEHFMQSYNVLNNKVNYRSRHLFTHIHAWELEEHVQFHIDRGNMALSKFMAIPHTILDVIPHFLSCILHLRNPFNTKI